MNHQSPTILIVEDSATQAQALAAQLSQYDIQVMLATNGAQALRIVRIQKPDLIVLDVNMPIMNGYQMCDRIRRDSETSHIPVILFTADESPESIQKGAEVGADGYIVKDDQAIENLLSIMRFWLTNERRSANVAH